jgi:hypothetical protein
MKIAEALLLRKQLEAKVQQLQPLKINGDQGVYKDEIQRVKVSDEVDEARIKIARIDIKSITREYDHYASELRKLDASIQKANWQFDVEYAEKAPAEDKAEAKTESAAA